ncbi:hypothetical protein HAX54_010095 [Datura stramonium]|uniref:Uncharacterized protein n=1 Tax=Datura stramonium TaxID=4076 RepID=A0ABS8RX82_DATST|nr:hypothetical protein [Datura stramonium]
MKRRKARRIRDLLQEEDTNNGGKPHKNTWGDRLAAEEVEDIEDGKLIIEKIKEKGLKNDPRCEQRRIRESWLGATAGVVRQPLNFREICNKVGAMGGVGHLEEN